MSYSELELFVEQSARQNKLANKQIPHIVLYNEQALYLIESEARCTIYDYKDDDGNSLLQGVKSKNPVNYADFTLDYVLKYDLPFFDFWDTIDARQGKLCALALNKDDDVREAVNEFIESLEGGECTWVFN